LRAITIGNAGCITEIHQVVIREMARYRLGKHETTQPRVENANTHDY
jgi:hypothetical protein